MDRHETSPVSTPRQTSAYATAAMPFKKFTYREDNSFVVEEAGQMQYDEDVVNFESDEEVAPYSEVPVRHFVPPSDPHPKSSLPDSLPLAVDEKLDISAYDRLPILERVTHAKWQVRLRAYQCIAKCLDTGIDLYSEKDVSVFEHYAGWLKEMATDKNLTAQMEGLKTMLAFVTHVSDVPQTTFLVAVDLLDKCPITKQAYSTVVLQILSLLLSRDSDCLMLGEIVKRVGSKRIHEATLLLRAISEHIQNHEVNPSQTAKILEAGRVALLHSHNEVRALGQKLCSDLVRVAFVPRDAFLKALKDVKPAIVKEISEVMDATPKEVQKIEIAPFVEAPGLLDFDYREPQPVSAACDLRALLHPRFAETAYLSNIKLKQEVLAHLKKALIGVSVVLDTADNAQTLNLLLNYMDDSNALVYSEVLQILELLVWKCPNMLVSRWKPLTHALCEKLKGNRKQAKMQVHKLLTSMCIQRVVSMGEMAELLVDLAKGHKNPQVREDALTWVAMELERLEDTITRETDLLSGGGAHREPVDVLAAAIGRKLMNISKTDVTAQVRDQAVRSLTLLLRLLTPGSEGHRQLEALVGKLHKVRVQEIQKNPARPSTAPGHQSVQLLDMDIPLRQITEEARVDLLPVQELSSQKEDSDKTLAESVRDLLDKRGSVKEFEVLISRTGQEGITENLQDVANSFVWVFQRCGSSERVSTVADACSYLSCLVLSLEACHPEDCVRLQTLVLLAASFSVCTQDLFSTMDTLFKISSKILFLRGLLKSILSLRTDPWSQLSPQQLVGVVRFAIQWVEQTSKLKTSVNYFQRANLHDMFQDTAYQQNYTEALLHEVDEFRSIVFAVCGEGGLMKATGVLRRLRQIEKMLKHDSAEMRLAGLDEFLKFAQCMQAENTPLSTRQPVRHRREASGGAESNPQTQRSHLPVIIVPLEELKRLLETVAAGVHVGKSALETDSYQTKALIVVKALRELISVAEAEDLFPVLAKTLPVAHYEDAFNSKVYFCLSDWLAVSPVSKVAGIVDKVAHTDAGKPAVHMVRWLGSVELRSKDLKLDDLSSAAKLIITGLNPEAVGQSFAEEDQSAYKVASEAVIRLLISKFDREKTINFFEMQLVSCGRLFQEFAKWLDSEFPDRQQPAVSIQSLDLSKIRVAPATPDCSELPEVSDLMERLRLESIAHDQTQHLLEKVNEDYMAQVSANYELQEQMKACKAENNKLEREVVKLRAALAQQHSETWTKPITALEDLKSLPRVSDVSSSRIDLFSKPPPAEASFLDLAEDGSEESLCVFQYLLISSTHPNHDLTLPLMATYESLDTQGKIRLLKCVSAAVSQDDVSKSITAGALKSLFQFNLRFLSGESKEITETGKELQHLLASLMDVRDRTITFCSLVIVLGEAIPEDYRETLSRDHRSFLKLCLKCLLRVHKAMVHITNSFSIWLELYRFFDRHPPEHLTVRTIQGDCPSLSDLEQAFKVLRGISDQLLTTAPTKAFAFLKFILATSKKAEGSLYVRYLAGALEKKHALRLGS